jgi:phosphatidate phosphatase APP1
MQITLTSKEFDEAVSLWLQAQGFTASTHSISTRVIAGRTDSGAGTRVEVTLEPILDASRNAQIQNKYAKAVTPVFEAMSLGGTPVVGTLEALVASAENLPTRKFGQPQGHADE